MAAFPSPAFHTTPLPLRPARPSILSRALRVPRRQANSLTMVAIRRSRARRMTTGLLNSDEPPRAKVRVEIEAPASNKRTVSACNLINAPLEIVWNVLTDYNRLSEYIPNLAISVQRPHPTDGIRVEQCGAQSILGFEFRASLTMDMTEVNGAAEEWRAIEFSLVSSSDFRQFDGLWRMEKMATNKTALCYSVNIMPKGIVPVRAIEWRISEDVPGNMDAVREECERRRRNYVADQRKNEVANTNGRDA